MKLYEKASPEELFSWIAFIREVFEKISILEERKILSDIYNSFYDSSEFNINPITFIRWIACPNYFDEKNGREGWDEVMKNIKERLLISAEIPIPLPYMREWYHGGIGDDKNNANIFWQFCDSLSESAEINETLFNEILKIKSWTIYGLGQFIFYIMPDKYYGTTQKVFDIAAVERSILKPTFSSYIAYQELMRNKFPNVSPYEFDIKSHGYTLKENQKYNFDRATRKCEHKQSLEEIRKCEEYERGILETESDEEVYKKAMAASKKPRVLECTTKTFARNQAVAEWVKRRAKGVCEICKKTAPFIAAKDEKPYLEAHHMIWLSKGGEDTIENTKALCPNCHRKLHLGKNIESKQGATI